MTGSRKKAVLSSPEVQRIVEQIKDYEPVKVILFGSTARGDTDEYSDIDLIVVKETGERFLQRLITVTGFLPQDLRIDVFVYTPEEFERMRDTITMQELLRGAIEI